MYLPVESGSAGFMVATSNASKGGRGAGYCANNPHSETETRAEIAIGRITILASLSIICAGGRCCAEARGAHHIRFGATEAVAAIQVAATQAWPNRAFNVTPVAHHRAHH